MVEVGVFTLPGIFKIWMLRNDSIIILRGDRRKWPFQLMHHSTCTAMPSTVFISRCSKDIEQCPNKQQLIFINGHEKKAK